MKKFIYITLSIILGILLSFILHALIEIIYLKIAMAGGLTVQWTSLFGKASCSLPLIVQILLLSGGIFTGYFLGNYWWQLIYIKRKGNQP